MTCFLTVAPTFTAVSADTAPTAIIEQQDRNQVLTIQHQDEIKQQRQHDQQQERRWFNNFKKAIIIGAIAIIALSIII